MNGTVIGKLVEAFYEQDEEKFKSFAQLVADSLREEGKEMGAKIIEERLKNKGKMDGEPTCCLDKEELESRVIHCDNCNTFYEMSEGALEWVMEHEMLLEGKEYIPTERKYNVLESTCPFCMNTTILEKRKAD